MAKTRPTARVRRAQPPTAATEAQRRGLLRLSLDLHDGPMQDLVAVGFALERLRRDLTELPVDAATLCLQVDGIRDQLAEVESALREVAAAQADRSRRSTLAQLVAREVDRFRKLDRAEVDLDLDEHVETETDSQRIALHRVLREALSNVHRHARARHVRIHLYEADDVIHLHVSDDGVGFEPAQVKRGLGLSGMHDRLRLLGSTLRVDSAPGGPTTVTAAVRRWRP